MAHPQTVPWPCPVTKPTPIVPQVSRKLAVIGHLVKRGEDRAVNNPIGHRMLEELSHHAQDVIDLAGARRPSLTRTRPAGWRGAQEDNEPAQITAGVLQTSTTTPTPAQEPGKLAGIHPRCGLGPIPAETQIEQEPVGHLNPGIAAIDHRPIRLTVRQNNPKRPKLTLD
jgi:hypothetical protein